MPITIDDFRNFYIKNELILDDFALEREMERFQFSYTRDENFKEIVDEMYTNQLRNEDIVSFINNFNASQEEYMGFYTYIINMSIIRAFKYRIRELEKRLNVCDQIIRNSKKLRETRVLRDVLPIEMREPNSDKYTSSFFGGQRKSRRRKSRL